MPAGTQNCTTCAQTCTHNSPTQNCTTCAQTCTHASPTQNTNASFTIAPCKYKSGNILGNGTYAVVKEMLHTKTGQVYAGKIISFQRMKGNRNLVQNEKRVLEKLQNNPFIVKLIDYFESQNNSYLITEKCNGGELFEYIHHQGSLGEMEAAYVIKQIVSGVAYIHKQGFVHRDIKTENCLIRTDQSGVPISIAIADFGMAYYMGNRPENSIVTEKCGTPGYMAPEMLTRSGYGKAIDMWAIGVITYFILSGTTPFQRGGKRGGKEEEYATINGSYSFSPSYRWKNVSYIARNFISSLLMIDPKKRMTAKQALQHPWLHSQSTPDPRLTTSMLNSYYHIADTHSQLSPGSEESGTWADQSANAQMHTAHKSFNSDSSQATKIDPQSPYGVGAKAHMSGSAGFGQTMPEEALGLGMIPECGFPEELAEQCILDHAFNGAESTNQAPSELSKLLNMQHDVAAHRYNLRSRQSAQS